MRPSPLLASVLLSSSLSLHVYDFVKRGDRGAGLVRGEACWWRPVLGLGNF